MQPFASMIEVPNQLMLLENVHVDFFLAPHPDRDAALQSLTMSKL